MMQDNSGFEPKLSASALGSKDPIENPAHDFVEVQGSKYNIMDDSNAAFVVLLHTFEYLTCSDLIKASRVSKIWNYVASLDIFWKKVELLHHPHDFSAFAEKLRKHGTQSLDIRVLRFDHKFLNGVYPPPSVPIFMSLKQVSTLTKIKLGICPSGTISVFAISMPQLRSISLSCFNMDFNNIWRLKNLEELELVFKNKYPCFHTCDFKPLRSVKSLKFLSFRRLNFTGKEIDYFPPGLESLVFGRCIRIPENFPTVIVSTFSNLKRMRLEDCRVGCLTTRIVAAVSTLPNLSQLELINFKIEEGFQTALGNCTQLDTLLIIPLYQAFHESLKAHQIAIEGAVNLKETLKRFVLGYCVEKVSRMNAVYIKAIRQGVSTNKFLIATLAVQKDKSNYLCCRPFSNNEVISSIDLLENGTLEKSLPKTKVKIIKLSFSKIWDQAV